MSNIMCQESIAPCHGAVVAENATTRRFVTVRQEVSRQVSLVLAETATCKEYLQVQTKAGHFIEAVEETKRLGKDHSKPSKGGAE